MEIYVRLKDICDIITVLQKENKESSGYDKMYELALKHVTNGLEKVPQQTFETHWYDAQIVRPKKSGQYLVKWGFRKGFNKPLYSNMFYSKKYNRWNCCDSYSKEDVEKYSLDIEFWTEDMP